MLNSDLLRYKDFDYVLWDVEVESLNLNFARPWQASWLLVKNKKIVEEHNHYIWWSDLKVSEKAALVTHFNYDIYKKQARPAAEVLKMIEPYLFDKKLKKVGHNILGYDTMIHQVWRHNLGLPPDFSYLNECIDTLALGRAYRFGHKYQKNIPFLAWQYSMLNIRNRNSSCGLSKLAKELEIETDENKLHDANYDSHINKYVFEGLIKVLEV